MTKIQLSDKWGRPLDLWSENGELITQGVDMEQVKAEIAQRIKELNAGPQPHTLAKRAWREAQEAKKRRR